MIRYALQCARDHAFEAWFASSDDFDDQAERGLVECPMCGETGVRKQIMAPALKAKRSDANPADDARKFVAAVRNHIRDTHDYVGDRFANEARAMHEGEKTTKPIYGEATPEDARALRDEGAPVAPLPAPFAPTPPKKLN